MKRTVRFTQTWDVEVDAEYGDTRADLIAKAGSTVSTDADVVAVIVEDGESQYAKWWDRPDADPGLVELHRAANAQRAGFFAGVRAWAAALVEKEA